MQIVEIGKNDIVSLGYLALFCTTIALLLQNIGQKYVAPSSASIILSLESVFGALFSFILYHETLGVQKIIGFALVFVAIMISEALPSFRIFKKAKVTN